MSPEERKLLDAEARTRHEIALIREGQGHERGIGPTLGDADWNAEAYLIRREQSKFRGKESQFEHFIRENYDRGDYIAVGRMERRGDEKVWHQEIKPVEDVVSDRYQKFLRAQNVHGQDIYISLNTFKPGGNRTKENLENIRHVGIDLDTGGKAAVDRVLTSGPPPHHVMETSPDRYQLWYQVRNMDRLQAEAATRGLARTFGGDPAATDAARTFRAPGFTNRKPEYGDLERPHWVREIPVTTRAEREYAPATFERYMEIGRERLIQSAPVRDRVPGGYRLSQSERDWAGVMDDLRKGREPAEIVQRLAESRSDKSNPNYYAAHTVENARHALELEREREHHHRR